jgi:hypothetical protein
LALRLCEQIETLVHAFMGLNKKLLMILAGIVLSGMLNPRAACADENHRVLMIIRKDDGTNGHPYYAPHLISVTTNKVEDIATLKGNVMFGSDDKIIAIVGGGNLLVVDRQKLTIIADMVLNNTYPVIIKTCPDENLAVDSARSKVYIPTYLRNPNNPNNYSATNMDWKIYVSEVDWKNGNLRRLSIPGGNYDRIISLPNAIGAEDGRSVSIYSESENETDRDGTLMRFTDFTPMGFYRDMTEPSDYYYVPNLGLFESRIILAAGYEEAASLEFQVTDKNLSTNHVNQIQINITNSPGHAFDYDGRFFVRNINGKLNWIWGENDGGTNSWTITKIVMANMESGKETLREPLNVKVWNGFMPNTDASKVYFFDEKAGQIYSFDRNSKTTSPFIKLLGYNGPWAFVDAD